MSPFPDETQSSTAIGREDVTTDRQCNRRAGGFEELGGGTDESEYIVGRERDTGSVKRCDTARLESRAWSGDVIAKAVGCEDVSGAGV